jgi:hypothetical protein
LASDSAAAAYEGRRAAGQLVDAVAEIVQQLPKLAADVAP